MPNFSPSAWELSGAGELGSSCDISAISGSKITAPARPGLTLKTYFFLRAVSAPEAGSGVPNDFAPYSDSILRAGMAKYFREVIAYPAPMSRC